MTVSRRIIPGTTYLLTRRCFERRFFMAPSKVELVNAMYYILAEAAQRYDIEIHVAIAMSSHHHTELTDPKGVVPKFAARLHRHWARAINCARGRWDGFWERTQPNLLELCDADAVWDKPSYVAANPVRAGLVEQVRYWPGLKVLPRDILGEGRVFKRPTFFFRDEETGGRMPDKVVLRAVKPPQFAHMSDQEYVRRAEADIAARCRPYRKGMRVRGDQFKGARAVRGQDWEAKPDTPAPRRVRHPHISAVDSDVRVEALRTRTNFLTEYQQALRAFKRRTVRKGSVVFPCGAWQMRNRHDVRCHPPPDSS